jgi:hypothetical protein
MGAAIVILIFMGGRANPLELLTIDGYYIYNIFINKINSWSSLWGVIK